MLMEPLIRFAFAFRKLNAVFVASFAPRSLSRPVHTSFPVPGQHLIAFTPDNRLAPCGRLADNGGPCDDWTPATIAAQLASLRDSLERETAQQRLATDCDSCPILKCCHGGCPAVRRAEHEHHEFCSQFRNFIAYLAHDGLRLLRQRLQDERRRTANLIDDLQKAMTTHQP